MASRKWKKRYFENQTIYTPPRGMVEFIVASGGSRLRLYWSKEGSFQVHPIGYADNLTEAFKEIRKFYTDAMGVAEGM